MTAPVTILDQRYSDAAATAVTWEESRVILQTAELSWLSTVRADGRPHVTPVVAAWADGVLYFHTGVGEQKFANLRANPNVVLTTGCSRWIGSGSPSLRRSFLTVVRTAVVNRSAFSSQTFSSSSPALTTRPPAASSTSSTPTS
jgi:general stress protein 26